MAPDRRQSKVKQSKAEERKQKTKPKKKRSSATTSFKSKSKTREAIAQRAKSFCAMSEKFLRKGLSLSAQAMRSDCARTWK
jgi:ppGpp synthetase/RelA/SpoT-type nucleotidyltranferase